MIGILSKAAWIALIVLASTGFQAQAKKASGKKVDKTANVKPLESRASVLKWADFGFNGQTYPMLYADQAILVNNRITSLEFFKPLQSPARAEVNPSPPKIKKDGDVTSITFGAPGEYYLVLNKHFRLRALILDRKQSIDENVLALYDFVAANTTNIDGNDAEWNGGNAIFTQNFFNSATPRLLLCGPTWSFFNTLIKSRFGLPTRAVTFTGTYFSGGTVQYNTHNVLEVYLPEHQKWVLFDPNNGFVAKWKDAFDITEAVRNASATKTSFSKEEFGKLELDFHYKVDVKRPFNNSTEHNRFFSGMLSKASQRDVWPFLMQMFLGGPGYWGSVGMAGQAAALPPEYDLYSSEYHLDPFLIEAQARWAANWPTLKVVRLSPDELKRRLDERYAPEIAERKWEAVAGY